MKPVITLFAICLILFSCNGRDKKEIKDSLRRVVALKDDLWQDSIEAIKEHPYLKNIHTIALPLKDIDGNVYKTVNIHGQIWMAENLRVTRYRNGDSIIQGTIRSASVSDDEVDTNVTGILYHVNYNPELDSTYGLSYNWYSLNDSRNIAPKGWHLPTESDFITLLNYISVYYHDNKALLGHYDLWLNGDAYLKTYYGGVSGFDAIPAGTWGFQKQRYYDNRGINGKNVFRPNDLASFWSITQGEKATDAKFFQFDNIGHLTKNIDDQIPDGGKNTGMSVRLIKDDN